MSQAGLPRNRCSTQKGGVNMSKSDVIVLGAGMVGISCALHLQGKGRTVTLVDRRPPAEETSFGNAGLIQREGVVPYMFPREWATIFRYALNNTTDAHYHLAALPRLAPWLFKYWRNSTPEGKAQSARAMMPLIERCILEHEAQMAAAGVSDMIRRTGYIRLYREESKLEAALAEDAEEKRLYGVAYTPLDRKALAELEPHLRDVAAGGVHMTDPCSVADPGALGKAYANLFTQRGGTFVEGEARTLDAVTDGWRVVGRSGDIVGRDVVIALGPWSDVVTRKLGLSIPLGWKRGYHMHYKVSGNAVLNRPVIDGTYGFALAPMARGIRLTTGAEFALPEAPPTPVQLERNEPHARELFPLAERVDPEPWMGRRPCLPDMVPVIGPSPKHKGVWMAFGHHHLGFTLGPITGRLLSEMMTGAPTVIDPTPYRADRFG